jgi:cell division protein FtsQ
MSQRGTRRSTILKRRSAGTERLIVFVKKFGIFLGLAALLFWIGSWFVLSGAMDRTKARIADSFYGMTVRQGFSVRNVLVDGRYYTDGDTLKAMIALEKGDPILAFNPAEAKARLEKLSWVRSAHVERRFPDTVYIRLTERKPLALWQRNQRLALIDAEGVVLTDRNLEAFKNLPIVVGEGAQFKAAELIGMLKAEPSIFERTEAATLISGRRWDLKLKSGAEVKLPEQELGLALRKLAVNHEEESILDKQVLSIDVREEGRITVRTKPGAAQDFNARITPAAGSPV